MIVYGGREEKVDPLGRLAEIRRLADAIDAAELSEHDAVVELLIAWGALESAAADALSPEADLESPLLRRFREGARSAGHLFRLSAQRRRSEHRLWLDRFRGALFEIGASSLPLALTERIPEGYAYYALYPESYLEAAARFFQAAGPRRAVCIGVRSIGASLSAVVAAGLEASGCSVQTHTVRPRGHPFERVLSLSAPMKAGLAAARGAHYLVIDEGPGLSGSSMTCVAQALSDLGIDDDRIVFFPSWEPDPQRFRSAAARERWERHRKYTVPFDLRLLASSPDRPLRDLSAGRWRALFYRAASAYPPVQPQHERRKYLSLHSAPSEARPLLLKFAGLGRYGRLRQSRAERLAEAGFIPEGVGLRRGFLRMSFVQGTPCSRGEIDRPLLEAMSRYLAFLAQTFPAAPSRSFDEVLEMIRVNVVEGIGEEWGGPLGRLERFRARFETARPIGVDGRMLPHEWLRTGAGFLKTDAVDHHDDHFFPGCQDVAWDVAGAAVEWGLTRPEEEALIDRYQSLANDPGLRGRLPFYKIAYLSYRLGYAQLAAEALEPAPDAGRFKTLLAAYRDRLQQELQGLPSISV